MATEQDSTRPGTIPAGPETTVRQGPPARVLSLIAAVRGKLRDYPELNRLISGVEHSDRQIALAMMECIDDWNTTPPVISARTVETMPFGVMINGTIVHLLHSAGFLQMRNQMSYSDGQGVSVSTSDKAPQYMAWANLFQQGYEKKKQRMKMAENLNGAMNASGFNSEYAAVNGWFETLE